MIKVVFIISFSPKYDEYANKPRPQYHCDTPSGGWVGIWGYDWGDLHLKALVENYTEYECEVWQPDLRADKMYSVSLHQRLLHKNYPARINKRFVRGRFVKEVYSQSMLIELKKICDQNTIVFLPASVNTKWINKIIAGTNRSKQIYFNYLNESNLVPVKFSTANCLKVINALVINIYKVNRIKGMKFLLTNFSDNEAIKLIRKINPNIEIHQLTLGTDLSYWQPISSKNEARAKLGIPESYFVIILSQRLVEGYQVDKFIEVVSRVKTNRSFCCYITGHGLPDYEIYLRNLVRKYQVQSKVKLVGYVPDEKLRDYFIAGDIFATFPVISAGSGGAIKAMAVGMPVLHSKTGTTYHFLRDTNSGAYLDPENYYDWQIQIERLIDGIDNIRVVDRNIVEKHYSWEQTADQTNTAIQACFTKK